MAQLDMRVYYDYYDLQNNSTTVAYRQGSQGSNCATPPVSSATCFTIDALTEEAGEAFFYTKNCGRVRRVLGLQPHQQAARRIRLGAKSSVTGRSTTRRCPNPTTTATGSSTRTPGWRQPERLDQVRVPAAAVRYHSSTTMLATSRRCILHALQRQQFRPQQGQAVPSIDADADARRRRRRERRRIPTIRTTSTSAPRTRASSTTRRSRGVTTS